MLVAAKTSHVQVPVLYLFLEQPPALLQRSPFLSHFKFTVIISKDLSLQPGGHFYHTICQIMTQLQQSREDKIFTALDGKWTFVRYHEYLSSHVILQHGIAQQTPTWSQGGNLVSDTKSHWKNTIMHCVSSQSQHTANCSLYVKYCPTTKTQNENTL